MKYPRFIIPVPADAPPPPLSHCTASYEYRNLQGQRQFIILRFDDPDGSKRFLPLSYSDQGWINKLPPEPRPLFGLETLGTTLRVVLTEGEKACCAARKIIGSGTPVLTWPNGAAAVDKVDIEPLRDKRVLLWPDADPLGMKAMQAMAERLVTIGCSVRVVTPPPDKPKGWDLADALAEGWDRARLSDWIETSSQSYEPATMMNDPSTDTDEWEKPASLEPDTMQPLPYPINGLPPTIRAAVSEVQGVTQAPLALVATCALGSAATATQGLTDVARKETLLGGIGLFFLIVAASGERKSTVDGLFTRGIREYEAEEQKRLKSSVETYKAQRTIFERKEQALKATIKANQTANETAKIQQELQDLYANEPTPPPVPRLIYSDVSTEALAVALGEWPSATLLSSEAGNVFGGYAARSENVTKTLATLNRLWDGYSDPIDRKTVQSTTGTPVRFSVLLQVQPQALSAFLQRTGDIARDIGLLARFFICHPETTQGSRLFEENDGPTPALDLFNSRTKACLETGLLLDDRGQLRKLPVLTMAPEAKELWIDFYNRTEESLKDGLELSDFVSKIADNTARLAGVFHLFEGRATGEAIQADHMAGAIDIASWHLSEARRLFETAQPSPEQHDAIALGRWLVDRAKNGLETLPVDILRLGPNRTRTATARDNTIAILVASNWIRTTLKGKQGVIAVNPHLTGDTPAIPAISATVEPEPPQTVARIATIAVAPNLDGGIFGVVGTPVSALDKSPDESPPSWLDNVPPPTGEGDYAAFDMGWGL